MCTGAEIQLLLLLLLLQVVNGFSDLMMEVFGAEAGLGPRSAVGVASLPMNTPVEVEVIFEVRPATSA